MCTVPCARRLHPLHPAAPVCASLKKAAGSRVLQEALAASQCQVLVWGAWGERAPWQSHFSLGSKADSGIGMAGGGNNPFIFRGQGSNPGLRASAVTSACSFSFCESCWGFSLICPLSLLGKTWRCLPWNTAAITSQTIIVKSCYLRQVGGRRKKKNKTISKSRCRSQEANMTPG